MLLFTPELLVLSVVAEGKLLLGLLGRPVTAKEVERDLARAPGHLHRARPSGAQHAKAVRRSCAKAEHRAASSCPHIAASSHHGQKLRDPRVGCLHLALNLGPEAHHVLAGTLLGLGDLPYVPLHGGHCGFHESLLGLHLLHIALVVTGLGPNAGNLGRGMVHLELSVSR
jgi:hypothetical protein